MNQGQKFSPSVIIVIGMPSLLPSLTLWFLLSLCWHTYLWVIAFSLCLYSISLLSRLRLPTLQMVWLGWYPSPWDQQEAQWREPHALLHFWLHHFLSIPHQLVDFHGFSLTVFQVFFMCTEKKFLIIIFFFFFLKYEFSTSAEHRMNLRLTLVENRRMLAIIHADQKGKCCLSSYS